MAVLWGDKRYNSLNYFLRQRFGEKVFKISLDAGFTCPNRDGKVSRGGCVFCSERGSGDFTGEGENLVEQFHSGISLMRRKWKSGKFIAYFQAYTNTYGSVSELREKYYSILNEKDLCGIAIATRPDCLDDEIIELLIELKSKTYLWIELGLQTSKEETSKLINRGYENDVYMNAVNRLHSADIDFVTHIIFGLPGEDKEDMLNTLKFVIASKPWGIKYHLLHLMKGTALEKLYEKGELRFLNQEEYIDLIVDAIELTPGDIVIHRLTGDSPRELLIGPMWSLKKWEVLNGIDQRLIERDAWQGKKAYRID